MEEIKKEDLSIILNSHYQQFIFIYTPFCGTCKLARRMLETIENIEGFPTFHTLNASLFPEFMQDYQVESVPCLVMMKKNQIQEKVYAFQSVPDMYRKIESYLNR
ncbi:thioredoxin family protein [Salinibacillus xinjiangensis]|uniref:Thioredoxin n=1 Tax=Salinibacillus xinjiangensis TaxID=1229268 RepID=A0A6G1X2D8_9BACI|nr:thioredoxin family protein [Salinibacillus xinjiangensis]MRG85153.1 thioredoxin [Salinibacillus xinjiangensis]